jgi:hypothetical protein
MSGSYIDMEWITVPDPDEIIILSDGRVGRRGSLPIRFSISDIKNRRFSLIDRSKPSNNDI